VGILNGEMMRCPQSFTAPRPLCDQVSNRITGPICTTPGGNFSQLPDGETREKLVTRPRVSPFLRPDLFRRAFHFNTQPVGKSAWPGRRILDHLDGMHAFRGHPMATLPRAGVHRRSLARDIANSTIGGMVAKVRFLAPCVVAQKYTRPAVGMHGFGRAGRRQGVMDDANECVLKNNSVTSRSCLDSVVAVGKCRLVLAEQVSALGAKHKT